MSIRTTVTLDEDVLSRVEAESKNRGSSFRATLNDLIRLGLLSASSSPRRRSITIVPLNMGRKSGLNYDDVEGLIACGEGEAHG